MKKLLSVILMLVLLCTTAAFAEPANPSLYALLENIGRPEIAVELVGHRWRCTYLMLNSGYCFDAEMIQGFYEFEINEDGTLTLKTFGKEDRTFPVEVDSVEGTTDIKFSVKNENGEYIFYFFLTKFSEFHPAGWDDYCMVMNDGTYYFLYFDSYAGVSDPVPALADVSIEDFDGKWMLKESSTMGRRTEYANYGYDFVVGAAMTNPDMICTFDSAAGVGNIGYYIEDGGVDFVYEEPFENGELKMFSDSFGTKNEDGTYSSNAVCRLHEDGTLSVENLGMRFILEKYVIDPLTEYTDKAIVKTVQEAMNYLGHECGTPDGISGKKTKAAISAYQAENGLTETGTVTEELLECLRGLGYSF